MYILTTVTPPLSTRATRTTLTITLMTGTTTDGLLLVDGGTIYGTEVDMDQDHGDTEDSLVTILCTDQEDIMVDVDTEVMVRPHAFVV